MFLIFLKKVVCSWAERSKKGLGTESERIKCYKCVTGIMEIKFSEARKRQNNCVM